MTWYMVYMRVRWGTLGVFTVALKVGMSVWRDSEYLLTDECVSTLAALSSTLRPLRGCETQPNAQYH